MKIHEFRSFEAARNGYIYLLTEPLPPYEPVETVKGEKSYEQWCHDFIVRWKKKNRANRHQLAIVREGNYIAIAANFDVDHVV